MTTQEELLTQLYTEVNPHFDGLEAEAIVHSILIARASPLLASTAAPGAVKMLTDPGTIPLGSSTDFVISYLNSFRDALIAAGMLDPGAGGGS